MKRKFKLFATLASLCLSVALMAFGVYAATTSTYHVTSKVSFDAQVVGVWKGRVSGGAPNTSGGAGTTPKQDPGQKSGNADTYEWVYNGSEATADPTWDAGEVKFGVANQQEKTLTYEFTFTNNSTGNANVKLLNTDTAFQIFNIKASSGLDATQLVVTVREAVASAVAEPQAATAEDTALALAKGDVAKSENTNGYVDIKAGAASNTALSGQTVEPGQAYALVITVTLADFTRQVPSGDGGIGKLNIKLLATPSWDVTTNS